MSKNLVGAGFGQAHEVFYLQVVIESGFFLGRKRAGLLPLDQFPHSLASRLGRLEIHDLARTERGDELDQFFVWLHAEKMV
ncbi:MAG: hypothetical protein KIT22_19155 [Verrucomicrobiae bacterium]|nr:hypothetical protein [Verrucomicrobiae bacterium]